MRRIREIAAEEEGFRLEPVAGSRLANIRRNAVEPEPVGTIILKPFRIVGYDPDCDGSLMARLAALDGELNETGWVADRIGLYPSTGLVVTDSELRQMWETSRRG